MTGQESLPADATKDVGVHQGDVMVLRGSSED